ncbi:MAG TPA: ABC transporter [Cryomorphaceae bacterium]|nr:ABC transporter [Owenweeksia sp.]HBF20375.1 ABC transporter [Cryomorphaceae bacterium]|tara:strand:+ start:348 stop:1664 length:1317 start_codon:yes stop_codon:yes gene_type:complete
MKEQDHIPTSRFSRTGNFLKTGAKVGGNYLKYYSKKLLGTDDTDALQRENAEDIYDALSKLKGSALKIAQMMSMDEGVLPKAFTDKFTQAQYSAPPLSYPLVVKTFKSQLGKSPSEVFDSFSKNAVAAASIGQVHLAERDGHKLAVKVQYPGVADSINSDLRIVKPLVSTMLNISSSEIDHYLQEVQARLMEETDYELELKRSMVIAKACAPIQGLEFPSYYPEFSSGRILTMDWLAGKHLSEFLKTDPSQETRNQLGQLLWDFYDFQIHELRQVHADPHPGNFLFREDGTIGVIDFGCIKEFSDQFYNDYFQLMIPEITNNDKNFEELLFKLDFLLPTDKPEEVAHFKRVYFEVHHLLSEPFFNDEFDFADPGYFARIYALSEVYQNDKMLRKAKAARGPRDSIYLNRTYFGLYSLLHKLEANIITRSKVGTLAEHS